MRSAPLRGQRTSAARRPALRGAGAVGLALLAASAGFALGARAPERWLERARPGCCVVRSVGVRGALRLAPAEIARAAGVSAGTSLADLDATALAARVAGHPWVASARAVTVPPDRLVLEVVERVPAAVVALRAGGDWLVDASGMPFASAAGEIQDGLPRLCGAEDAAPGRSDPRLAEGIAIARTVRAHGLSPALEVELRGEKPGAAPSLRLSRPGARVVLGPGELERKLERLAALLDADLAEVAAADSIDLRFGDRMVLRSETSPDGDAAAARGGATPGKATKGG